MYFLLTNSCTPKCMCCHNPSANVNKTFKLLYYTMKRGHKKKIITISFTRKTKMVYAARVVVRQSLSLLIKDIINTAENVE